MKLAYKIGVFIRNFMDDEESVSASSIMDKQQHIFGDYRFADTFEVIMLLFMLSRYDFLEHIDRDRGYRVTDKLYDEFPIIDKWINKHGSFIEMLKELDCDDLWLVIMFRSRTWIYRGELLTLDLEDLLIKELRDNIFTEFTELEQIYLNGNLLGTLSNEVFKDMTKLRLIDLSSNMISNLPLHIFANNDRLKSVNLANNGIDSTWLVKFRTLNRLTGHETEIII